MTLIIIQKNGEYKENIMRQKENIMRQVIRNFAIEAAVGIVTIILLVYFIILFICGTN